MYPAYALSHTLFPGKNFPQTSKCIFSRVNAGWRDSCGDAGMAQWWEHSSPTAMARVRFPDLVSHVGWVCCWFSSLLRGFFSGFSAGCTTFWFLAILVLLQYFASEQALWFRSVVIYLGGHFRFGNIGKNLTSKTQQLFSPEGVHHGGYWWSLSLANIIKI